ncbi:MAG TPA: hypothetical protein PKW95_07635 [bacterium]|nr:hypothetical protein [bacterium]
MKKVALLVAVVLVLSIAAGAVADSSTQTINILISKILKNYAMKTDFGNVYFNMSDLRKLVDSAAKLRPINLGNFVTDQNNVVKIQALGYDKGVVTILVTSLGAAQ